MQFLHGEMNSKWMLVVQTTTQKKKPSTNLFRLVGSRSVGERPSFGIVVTSPPTENSGGSCGKSAGAVHGVLLLFGVVGGVAGHSLRSGMGICLVGLGLDCCRLMGK